MEGFRAGSDAKINHVKDILCSYNGQKNDNYHLKFSSMTLATKLKQPFTWRELDIIYREWSKLFAPECPADVHIIGGSALITCARFQEMAGKITRGAVRRLAWDIDYGLESSIDDGAGEGMKFALAAACGLEYYSLMDGYFLDSSGEKWVSIFISQRERYFYRKPAFDDQQESGLRIFILKEGPQLALKISDASYGIENRNGRAGHEMYKALADISRLCRLMQIGDAEGLRKVWESHARILGQNENDHCCNQIWKRVAALRGNRARNSIAKRQQAQREPCVLLDAA